jgi:hypothetical protein
LLLERVEKGAMTFSITTHSKKTGLICNTQHN